MQTSETHKDLALKKIFELELVKGKPIPVYSLVLQGISVKRQTYKKSCCFLKGSTLGKRGLPKWHLKKNLNIYSTIIFIKYYKQGMKYKYNLLILSFDRNSLEYRGPLQNDFLYERKATQIQTFFFAKHPSWSHLSALTYLSLKQEKI